MASSPGGEKSHAQTGKENNQRNKSGPEQVQRVSRL
jgi:hypothetical protein